MVENEGAGHQQHESQETPAAGTLSHENPASGNQHAAKGSYASAREWARIVMEFIALIALVYYAHQSAIQATASRDAADAARGAVRDARERGRLDLRAYMGVGGFVYDGVNDDGKLRFSVPLANRGRTPAAHVTFNWTTFALPKGMSMFPTGHPADPFASCPPIRENQEVGIFASGMEVPEPMTGPMPQPSSSALGAFLGRIGRSLTPHVYGCIKYRDVFGDAHTTEFCGYWDADAGRGHFCERGNNFD